MQRTVKSIKFTYVDTEIINDEIVTAKKSITIFNETDEKKALKKAVKQIGLFKPLKTDIEEDLYKLDDETFFKYAVKVEKTEATKEVEKTEATEK